MRSQLSFLTALQRGSQDARTMRSVWLSQAYTVMTAEVARRTMARQPSVRKATCMRLDDHGVRLGSLWSQ